MTRSVRKGDKDFYVSSGGLVTEMQWDDDGVTLKHSQDTRIIDASIRKMNEAAENRNREANTRWIASIPQVVYAQWQGEYNSRPQDSDWDQYLAMKLNSSDYSKLRTERV